MYKAVVTKAENVDNAFGYCDVTQLIKHTVFAIYFKVIIFIKYIVTMFPL